MSEHDRIFFKNFSIVIGILMVTTVALIVFATMVNSKVNRPDNPDKVARVEDRIKAVGDVYTSDNPRPAQPQVAKAAFDGSMDGGEIYAKVCQACHTAGIAGAPKMELAEWTARMEQGNEQLIAHAIEGYQGSAGYMPPRGGKMDLSDEQVAVTVEWMLDNLE